MESGKKKEILTSQLNHARPDDLHHREKNCIFSRGKREESCIFSTSVNQQRHTWTQCKGRYSKGRTRQVYGYITVSSITLVLDVLLLQPKYPFGSSLHTRPRSVNQKPPATCSSLNSRHLTPMLAVTRASTRLDLYMCQYLVAPYFAPAARNSFCLHVSAWLRSSKITPSAQ